MADGSVKRIDEIKLGDQVLATDPETGESGPREVTATIIGDGIKFLVEIEVDGASTINATDRHLFWLPDENRWRFAKGLHIGSGLTTSTGTRVQVSAVQKRVEAKRVHNLTVAGIHTYYVLAGNTPVLVHNECGILSESKAIANHANRRFMDPDGFEHYVKGVDPKALDAYVDGVLEGQVPNVTTRYLERGRVAHWDPNKSAVIIEDGAGGTVFTPREGRTYFDELE